MKGTVKNILKFLKVYHPLQSFYRNAIFNYQRKRNRKNYSSYKGAGFTCNVCNEKYTQFVPDYPSEENRQAIDNNKIVAGYGENIFCPNCMSTARERLLIAKLAEFDLKDKEVLHLSPEKNIYHFIKAKAHVTTADLLPGFYKTIDGMVQKQDATHFSYADNRFDLVIANHILEHIPDDKKAMSEIYRVLKPGGSAILQVPYTEYLDETIEIPGINDPAKQSFLFGQKDHVRIYLLGDYVSRLQQAGFRAEIIPYAALEKYYPFAIQQHECFIDISKPISA
ncbi:MAG TPA: methyltransferase domain-containing protein [Ferruginibacter sp.]|nr:methyltransferase domain-containing protein [Ferruginibacter sp.]